MNRFLSTNNYRYSICVFSLLALGLFMSCSGNNSPVSTAPSDQPGPVLTPINERNARTPEGFANHSVWGTYTMIIDQETKTIEVIDNRELAVHLNVRGILENPWWCPAKNCIQILFLNIDEANHIYTIKGTLVNPTHFTGYDVRVIIFLDEKGHKLLNADDYSMLYEEESDINPFKAYAKTVENRKFAKYTSFSEIFEMYIPPVPKKFKINFAIDASWPGNCEEPYDLEEFGYEGYIYPDDPSVSGTDQGSGLIFTKVYDWQDNVSQVTVDTTPITGNLTELEYNPDTKRWEAQITNAMDAIPGDYVCLIAAYSFDDPTIGLYNYLTIHVDETPPPAVQTIYGKVVDALYMYDLDGTVVKAINQDPLGFQPEPTTVVNGEYEIKVTPGIYDLSVVADDGLHFSQTATNVIVSTNENVKLNFGLIDPTQTDPYGAWDYASWPVIMGFAGRVVDPLGMPVSGATIEFTFPGTWYAGQEFLQADVSDKNGYFSATNLPIETDAWSGETISYYRVKIRADGYFENDIGDIPSQANTVPYHVISLTPTNEIPIWTESFETDSGWSFSGYYHRQLWNQSIVNISFDPDKNYCVMPPDEMHGGAIPMPVDGQYLLWYGVEQDGNFLGPWSPSSQTQWNGGTSLDEHQGYATSPQINLSGYTYARLEFDMAFDQESMDTPSFERMYLYINGNEIYQFNPFVDPDTRAFSFTQRGQNRTMIWCHYVFDISSYAGAPITIGFSFDTWDNLYNGFRGQCIDNIKIYAK